MSGNVKKEKCRSAPWRAQQDAGRETRCPESSQDWGLCWESEYLWAVCLSGKFLKLSGLIILRGLSTKVPLRRENVCFKYETCWTTKIYVVFCLSLNLNVAWASYCGGEGKQYNVWNVITFLTFCYVKLLEGCDRIGL